MKQEFMAMMQQKAHKQIQTQMQAMHELQTEAGQLTAKIDGMQERIRDSLAKTVRNAIVHVMQSQPPTKPRAQSENAQDGACPTSAGTDT
jgi:hypothetical protein